MIVHRRKAVVQGPAHHGGDQLIHVGFLRFPGQNHFAVPKHGNLIANLKNLIHFMRDIDQRYSLLLKVSHHLKQFGNLFHCQRGCRLVEHNQLCVVRYCLGNFHHLPCGN